MALDLRCDDTNITVHAAAAEDARSACAAAGDAIGFLRGQGLNTSTTFDLFVVDALPSPISAAAFGGYIHDERRAYLLTYARIAERGIVFGLPFDRTLYRALATHEVTHAIAAVNFRFTEPPIEAQEYIAYTAMFATLPQDHRAPLLARFADATFEDESKINRLVYFLDPFRFGLLAYKHFIQPSNGAAFIQRVLAGRALRDFVQ